jgi:hypothetical protein
MAKDATDTPSARAMPCNASQNSDSRETLVAYPARTTERLSVEGLAKVFLMCADVDALKSILEALVLPFKDRVGVEEIYAP